MLIMATNETRVEIFEPPMCCSTGLCGPTIDPVLLDVSEMVLKLSSQGVVVQRYVMNQQPQAFLNNPAVYRLVQERQLTALPITAVNGQIIKTGAYPTLSEVQAALNGDGTSGQDATLPAHAVQGAYQTSQ
jgi:2-keto-4-pentenoate hydratase